MVLLLLSACRTAEPEMLDVGPLVGRWSGHPQVTDAWALVDGAAAGALPTEVATGSLRKWTTAAVVVRLVERGVLDLDAPVGHWLPTWSEQEGVTLRRLLSHTSGLPARPPSGTCAGLQTLEACVDAMAAVDPVAPPGTRFHYSSAGFHVAARVAEVAGKAPYEALFQREVVEPLGLTSVRFDAAGDGLAEMTGTLWMAPADVERFVHGVATGQGAKGRWLRASSVALLHGGHSGAPPRSGTIPRGEWWTEGEDYYALGAWRAGAPVEGGVRFLFSEGKQELVAGVDRGSGRVFVVGLSYRPGARPADRLEPHEVMHELCVAGDRLDGRSQAEAWVACLPFAADVAQAAVYRRCRSGEGDHRICLTAARRSR